MVGRERIRNPQQRYSERFHSAGLRSHPPHEEGNTLAAEVKALGGEFIELRATGALFTVDGGLTVT